MRARGDPPQTVTSREESVYLVKIAEQAERYDGKFPMYSRAGLNFVDMADLITSTLTRGGDPTTDERSLLAVAYKNAIGARRASWRLLCAVEAREKAKGRQRQADLAAAARAAVEAELASRCGAVLDLLQQHLVPSATNVESQVFFSKM